LRGKVLEGLENSIALKERIVANSDILEEIEKISDTIISAYRRGKKTIFAGNGGSAADAQHLAGELVSRFYFDRPALASIALTTDTSILTAVGNDYGYDHIFARQIEGNGQSGDIFIAISTSGNSKNILNAIKVAKERELIVVGLTGDGGGEMASLCDLIIKVPSKDTPRIQEAHITIGHIIADVVESEIFSS
jgi:D-sedoheptulose 7-phosphate isomerase